MSVDLDIRFKERIGKTVWSDWVLIDQVMIDKFAAATQDFQYIHVDPERAAQTMFGGTIAHGLLLLSLLPMLRPASSRVDGIRMGINYGFDRVRFVNPVRSGSRIRAGFTTAALELKDSGRYQETLDILVELEGMEKPALSARWITQFLV